MTLWQIWLTVGVVFFVIELLNTGFGIICIGFGALLASVLSACGLGLAWQIIGLCIGSFLSFLFVRPVMKKWLDGRNKPKTNLDSIIGRKATVIEVFKDGKGRVAIDGTDWNASSLSSDTIENGKTVTISDRNGNTLIVNKQN